MIVDLTGEVPMVNSPDGSIPLTQVAPIRTSVAPIATGSMSSSSRTNPHHNLERLLELLKHRLPQAASQLLSEVPAREVSDVSPSASGPQTKDKSKKSRSSSRETQTPKSKKYQMFIANQLSELKAAHPLVPHDVAVEMATKAWKGRPKRAPSAYNLFMRDKISELKAANPTLHHSEVFRMAAQAWKMR